ncbi:hypothetical protein [Aeromonas phage 4L372D]|uniref:Uncharacterized protein n=4 Tax=Plateaulakevirus TaxID=2843436 RepID=A0A5B9N817_9CAUD|nr:hypothetical protein HWC25_gp191 [Aeromonas phage 2L372D]YP_009846529.1 hypothetical protein HWC26_gp192 [Aeromonas phage 2L372X]YP_009846756.1 hypothetical protein HWC27_gp183 [Aeromonas phage 4L372D]QDB74105.1 hypothetical protein 2L372D_191 [Aeromonas phage 2L372D]QEG08444.1 hypothetical protein [Aeromonas phage 2L372X]QEG08672.1 hypothetical protein [Aeromonas phage 4L372D]
MKDKTITKADYGTFMYESDWGEEPYPELVQIWTDLVAKDHDIDKKCIKIWWCAPVAEYCIDIDGKWTGYFEVDNYFRGGHWSGWDKFENGKGENYEYI